MRDPLSWMAATGASLLAGGLVGATVAQLRKAGRQDAARLARHHDLVARLASARELRAASVRLGRDQRVVSR